jgi:hypothetical protein
MSDQPPPVDDHDVDRPADHASATNLRPTDHRSGTTRSATDRPGDQASIAPLAELIAELTRENRELAAAAAQWQERARFLGERLQALEARPVAGDIQEAGLIHERGHQPGAVAPEASEPPRSGWRRWWRRMMWGG